MLSGSVPPCCRGCAEYDGLALACRLLADPTLENRRRLLAMPCDVERLVSRRFSRYEDDVARDAVATWLHPDWPAQAIVASYGQAPLDARLWLTSFPNLYLARNAGARVKHDQPSRPLDLDGPLEGPVALDPNLPARIVRALDRVRRVDAVGYAMLLDVLRDQFDPNAWAARLGSSEAGIADRKALAIYRYAAYLSEIFDAIQPHEAAVALRARCFAPGEVTEDAALETTRETLGEATMTLARYRDLYRQGAARSLELLAAPDALGAAAMAQVGPALRRVLRMD